MAVTKRVGVFGPSSMDLRGAAWDCCLQPWLGAGGEHLPPRAGMEIPSSHLELAEGDGVILFNN